MRSHRRGFTLIELLVVVSILAILSVFVVYAFTPGSANKMRDAGRIGQAAILGARDRALHAKLNRGFRLLIDPNDNTMALGFVYIQPIAYQPYPLGSFSLDRKDVLPGPPDNLADSPEIYIVNGVTTGVGSVDWWSLTSFFGSNPRIRIPSGLSGQWYNFTYNTAATGTMAQNLQKLELLSPFSDTTGALPFASVVAFPTTNGSYTSCDLDIGNEMLPNHQPINLPSGVVIDLKTNRSSPNAKLDIMFSPRGTISGYLTAQGPIYLLIRDVRDAANNLDPSRPDLQGDQRVLAIFPQTGHVACYEVDVTDTTPADGVADDPFRFAKTGQAAGG